VLHELLADATDVRDRRVLSDPDAVVDDAADVLGEVPVQFRPDRPDALAGEDLDRRGRGRACRGEAAPPVAAF